MPETVQQPSASTTSDDRQPRLKQAIAKAAELLPLPGPITAFAFLNTLQALERLPFDEGMREGARLYGCEPYLSEDRYREKLARGRIRVEDLAAVLIESLGDRDDEWIGSLGTRYELQLAMLQHPLQIGPAEELRWFVAEMDALKRFRHEAPAAVRERFVEETRHWVLRDLRGGTAPKSSPQSPSVAASDDAAPEERMRRALSDLARGFGESSIEHFSEPTRKWEALALSALWRVCYDGVSRFERVEPSAPSPVRCRDELRNATGEDTDPLVNEVLIRFCAAFTDQGLAHWPLPERSGGFYQAFCSLYRRPGGPPNRWLRDLPRELARLDQLGLGPLESIVDSLELLGVADEAWDQVIPASLLALRGWAGMLWHMETRSDRVPLAVGSGTLAEFLAVRLVLERVALAYVASEILGYHGPLDGLRAAARARMGKRQPTSIEQLAFLVFQLAQVRGWTPPALCRMSPKEWSALVAEIEAFSGIERRWMFHQAFERRLRVQTLDALSVHARRGVKRVASPRFQISFCLDAREESFRRHLEETAPDVETFGAAGFYGVAMYYRGAADAHFTALCPIVVKPQHWVVEDVVFTLEETNRRRAKTRRALGTASHQVHVGSRGIAGGALLAAGLGVLASVPLVARVLFPRLTARIRRTALGFVQPPPISRLRLERRSPTAGPTEEQFGYTVEEMAAIGERLLRDIGLTSGFARLVLILGHGSFCLNNPHKSVYDCGACSGSPGGPNGRAMAAILNDRRVRETLADHGLQIPDETVFLGGLHNTAVDSVTFLDLDVLPRSHFDDVERAQAILAEVCRRNAHER
ncbi:MAG TPA: putative inorganic carbon transporter subunit DabA, partial [Pirellulales bacterium]|nr:putative inorganic carbon transporter subunit DabA [Pirellulales bacterium]